MCDEWYPENDPVSVKVHQHPEPQSGPARDAWLASRMKYEDWIYKTPEGREWARLDMRLASVTNVVQKISSDTIPDGRYTGTWGGYRVRFNAHGRHYEGDSDIGIRTPSAPCVVIVNGGKVLVRVKGETEV
jgi:hypothetical protein